ncbi:unnamed protein product [Rhizoctonia solani]|uniref:O-methylsterigmatocystin oxidoreductase n=1 Tax=Rhizoctonia solani TaxID=456999 RepID=A0A8H2WHT4_9AGAM|nr:unnamed protein product [Rhizoctonia solani]
MVLNPIRQPFATSSHISLVATAVTLALASWTLYALPRRTQKLPLPPGPKSDPVIGHLRVMPASDEHRVYAKWGKELNSDIISISILGQTIVVLNSTNAASELLDRRSAIYSDRPELPMVSHPDLVDWSKNTAIMRYGERWRSQRRMTNRVLNKGASTQLWPVVVEQCRLALQRISTSPENFIREIRRMMGSTLLSTVYGYEVTSAHDHLVELVEIAVDHFSDAVIPGNFYVNMIPWLRHVPDWFPGAGWKQVIKTWRKEKDEVVNMPFDWTKNQTISGTAAHSMVQSLLTDLENSSDAEQDSTETEEKIKWAAVAIFLAGWLIAGGTDTSAAAILLFILAMTLNQHVVAKAQAEIDQVIGQERLPEMSDRESLPYIECVMREVLRWKPVGPIGLPHACMEDDEYQDYFIPKGAVVISNIWAMCHDDSIYHEPEKFDPDRFLDPQVPRPPIFGFGRRLCPGVHMAESTLFITIATFLALFDIRPVKDEKGREILPEVKMKSNTAISYPADFKCSITPRSEKAMETLKLSIA